MGNKFKLSILATSFFCIFISNPNCNAESSTDKRIAKKIAKEKGVLKPDEVWQWQASSKDIPKDWIKIDNKFFSASYDPNCFSIEGEGGEDDPKIAPSVLFRRKKNCFHFKENHVDSEWLSIGYFPDGGVKTLAGASTADYPLVRQKIKINGVDAISLGGLMDYWDESNRKYMPQLRWQLFLICNKKTFRIGTIIPPGQPTMDLVEKNNYAWPEDFKAVISTFQCK